MFSSLEDFENSRAFWVLLVLGSPLLFMVIWSFVLWITSHMSGWRQLATLYPYNNEQVIQWKYRGGGGIYRATFPFAGMRGRLAIGANKVGYVVKAPIIMRPFHPKLFLPFEKIQSEEEQKQVRLDLVIMTMTDVLDIRIAILKSARDMAENIRAACARDLVT